jgi:glycosyltransferase involved in cell wall biosynthesis
MERALVAEGIRPTVVTTDDDGPGKHLSVPLGRPESSNGGTRFYFRKQTEFYKISYPLHLWLREHIQEYDLAHIHALFSFSSWSAARAAQRRRIPYIVRPLGVLNRWGMENRRPLLKRLSMRLVESPMLRRAAGMHYTSRQEQTEAAGAGATARPWIIPLGIDLVPFKPKADAGRFFERYPAACGRRLLLFLSRLDEKKGLDILMPAFAKVRRVHPDATLVIAGQGPDNFVKKCRDLARAAGVTDAVIWAGFLEGEDKLAAFAAASVFVLPSYSENFGLAVVEALAAGLPCVLCRGVAISEDVAAAGAGLLVPPEIEALAEGLIQLLSDEERRLRCTENARRLAENRFSLSAMGKSLASVYREVLHGFS